MRFRKWLLVFALAINLPLPVMAAAMAAASGNAPAVLSSTEWRVECGNDGKTLNCQIIDHIFQQNGAEIASIAVHPAAEAGQNYAVVQLPLGLALNAPVKLNVGEASVVLTVNTCVQQGCIAAAALSPDFVSALIAGSKLGLAFGMANSRTVTMAVPLTGFGWPIIT